MEWFKRIFGSPDVKLEKTDHQEAGGGLSPAWVDQDFSGLPSDRQIVDVYGAGERPPGNWRVLCVSKIAGVSYRIKEVQAFVLAAETLGIENVRIKLRPDPTNKHDKNAIAVWGEALDRKWHVGYLPSDLVNEIREQIPQNIALGAALRAGSLFPDGGGFLRIEILVPRTGQEHPLETDIHDGRRVGD